MQNHKVSAAHSCRNNIHSQANITYAHTQPQPHITNTTTTTHNTHDQSLTRAGVCRRITRVHTHVEAKLSTLDKEQYTPTPRQKHTHSRVLGGASCRSNRCPTHTTHTLITPQTYTSDGTSDRRHDTHPQPHTNTRMAHGKGKIKARRGQEQGKSHPPNTHTLTPLHKHTQRLDVETKSAATTHTATTHTYTQRLDAKT